MDVHFQNSISFIFQNYNIKQGYFRNYTNNILKLYLPDAQEKLQSVFSH